MNPIEGSCCHATTSTTSSRENKPIKNVVSFQNSQQHSSHIKLSSLHQDSLEEIYSCGLHSSGQTGLQISTTTSSSSAPSSTRNSQNLTSSSSSSSHRSRSNYSSNYHVPTNCSYSSATSAMPNTSPMMRPLRIPHLYNVMFDSSAESSCCQNDTGAGSRILDSSSSSNSSTPDLDEVFSTQNLNASEDMGEFNSREELSSSEEEQVIENSMNSKHSGSKRLQSKSTTHSSSTALIKSVHCGWYHSLILTMSGKILSCGANYSHQAGQSCTSNVQTFKPILSIKHPIQMASCGGHHSIAVTLTGDVYLWGECREGQLGVSGLEKLSSTPPTFVEHEKFFQPLALEKNALRKNAIASMNTSPSSASLNVHSQRTNSSPFKSSPVGIPPIVKVCCGGYHSIMILADHTVCAFGKNTYGQCGVWEKLDIQASQASLDEFRVLTPTLIKHFLVPKKNLSQYIHTELLSKRSLSEQAAFYRETTSSHNHSNSIQYSWQDVDIVDCAAGAWHTLLLTKQGRVFGLGDTQYGQLGLENRQDDNSTNPSTSSTRYPLPFLISSLQHERIAAVSCGYFHSVFLTRDGRVYTVGWNAYGQLLVGNTKTHRQVTLVKSLIGIPIVKVSCGWNHGVLLSREGHCYVGGEGKHGQLGYDHHALTEKCLKHLTDCYCHKNVEETSCLEKSSSNTSSSSSNSGCSNSNEEQNCFVCLPLRVGFFHSSKILDVACGRGHTLFLSRGHIPCSKTMLNGDVNAPRHYYYYSCSQNVSPHEVLPLGKALNHEDFGDVILSVRSVVPTFSPSIPNVHHQNKTEKQPSHSNHQYHASSTP
ncbi:hypothetical protein C9374_001547 [Naegleria lovaniensis]|uniref:Uncharacterized protein n=1 Tax=Naegleria lovaniensis TaxID=51637 RepID=A0AA88GQV4_NAELO|nr:uncharacterized protein C9374_001547 [Naegleria lovaniensis]KAG2387215.1 hypothetical protein C9374_001547 [Naegleria lovaniensis]